MPWHDQLNTLGNDLLAGVALQLCLTWHSGSEGWHLTLCSMQGAAHVTQEAE